MLALRRRQRKEGHHLLMQVRKLLKGYGVGSASTSISLGKNDVMGAICAPLRSA
jgi:hypothetical protein